MNNNNFQEGNAGAGGDSKSVHVFFSINSFENVNELQSVVSSEPETKTGLQTALLLESIVNKKCRDDLYEMRNLYNPEPEPSSLKGFTEDIPAHYDTNEKPSKAFDDSILRKYFQSNGAAAVKGKSEAKYFTYSPDTFQSISTKKALKKQNRMTHDQGSLLYLCMQIVKKH